MSRVVSNGLSSIHRLREEMDRVFSHAFGDLATGPARVGTFPPLNIWEDNEFVYVEAELPGMTIEQVEITARHNELSIAGERTYQLGEGAAFHRRERGMGKFHRVVRLPYPVELDKVEARLKDGVLTIALPKAEEVRPRKIEVRCE